jgi:hypothetical protein
MQSTESLANAITHAVTVHRPWGHAIAHLGKPVENRNYRCHLPIGTLIAIHNGAEWDYPALAMVKEIAQQPDLKLTYNTDPAMFVIAIARFGGNVTEHESPWFFGPYGWLLEDVTLIEPVFCRGQQRIWHLTPIAAAQVNANYQAAIQTR